MTAHGKPRFLLLAFALAGLAACSEEPTARPAASTAAVEVPEQQIFDYRLIESEAGTRQWILESAEMQKFPGQQDMILSEVHMEFFRDGVHFSTLDADSGRANTRTRDVLTWGSVVLVTDDGRRLETEELSFSNETGMIHNDVFNRFTRGAEWMTGIGLDATPDLDYFEMRSEAQAEVRDGSGFVGVAVPKKQSAKATSESDPK